MVVHLTIDTSGEQPNNLLTVPNFAFVIKQKQLPLYCESVGEPLEADMPTFRGQQLILSITNILLHSNEVMLSQPRESDSIYQVGA